MQLGKRQVLICDCEGTMPLDGRSLAKLCGAESGACVHHHLCGPERDAAASALSGEDPVLIACQQQAPLFRRLAAELGHRGALDFVDIRESAGWTAAAAGSLPKMAALLAAAPTAGEPQETVTLTSAGSCLVYGRGEEALDAARRLASRLDVTLVLDVEDDSGVSSPSSFDIPIVAGHLVRLRGHLGAFDVEIDRHAEVRPSSHGTLAFGARSDGMASRCDIVVDLSGDPPLLPGGPRRHGYLRAEPGDTLAVERVLFEAAGLVGTFEKPRHMSFRADRCAHSRNGRVGCTRCLDVCPLSAIRPDGDVVAIDPGICDGCGACHAACPTGAASQAGEAAAARADRLRKLFVTYRDAGGRHPVLLLHDAAHGAEMVRLMAQFGRGLPAHVLPFVVDEIAQVGLDLLLAALAYGARQVIVLAHPARAGGLAGLEAATDTAGRVAAALGYGEDRLRICSESDPDALEALLHGDVPAGTPVEARFAGSGSTRGTARLALAALHDAAPTPRTVVPLADGAPFGGLEVDRGACTLCLSCVAVCPTGALADNPEKPQLRFSEDACVQCGLCRTTCPESAITLMPRINFADEARRPVVLHEEEPFHCVRCGKPFGVRSSIERVIGQLAGRHPMFQDPAALEALRMCGDCRVKEQFSAPRHAMPGRQGSAQRWRSI